ncbi:MAG: sigma-70 family RNA polymerase sigma factor [Spirochaetes bacterium]|nr:sigma-70 family RNA polymerase sigma factor [Spirochaetota bacterium]
MMKEIDSNKLNKESFDIKIKKLLHDYKNGEEVVLSEILPLLIPVIYSFPYKNGSPDSETVDRFYNDIFNRIHAILRSYNIKNTKFTTWFYTVLRNSFLNIKRKESSLLCMERVNEYQTSFHSRFDNDNEIEIFKKLCSNLSKKEFYILKIRYPGLLERDDILSICTIFNQNRYRVYKMYLELKNRYRFVEEMNNKLKNKITCLLQAKKRIERQLYIHESEASGYQMYKKRLINIDKTRYSMIKKLKRQTAVVTIKEISYYLDIPLGTVSTAVNRAAKKIKKMGGYLNQTGSRKLI